MRMRLVGYHLMVTVKKQLWTNKDIDILGINTYMEIVILRIT